jgi:hypothetical protein
MLAVLNFIAVTFLITPRLPSNAQNTTAAQLIPYSGLQPKLVEPNSSNPD